MESKIISLLKIFIKACKGDVWYERDLEKFIKSENDVNVQTFYIKLRSYLLQYFLKKNFEPISDHIQKLIIYPIENIKKDSKTAFKFIYERVQNERFSNHDISKNLVLEGFMSNPNYSKTFSNMKEWYKKIIFEMDIEVHGIIESSFLEVEEEKEKNLNLLVVEAWKEKIKKMYSDGHYGQAIKACQETFREEYEKKFKEKIRHLEINRLKAGKEVAEILNAELKAIKDFRGHIKMKAGEFDKLPISIQKSLARLIINNLFSIYSFFIEIETTT